MFRADGFHWSCTCLGDLKPQPVAAKRPAVRLLYGRGVTKGMRLSRRTNTPGCRFLDSQSLRLMISTFILLHTADHLN